MRDIDIEIDVFEDRQHQMVTCLACYNRLVGRDYFLNSTTYQ